MMMMMMIFEQKFTKTIWSTNYIENIRDQLTSLSSKTLSRHVSEPVKSRLHPI